MATTKTRKKRVSKAKAEKFYTAKNGSVIKMVWNEFLGRHIVA